MREIKFRAWDTINEKYIGYWGVFDNQEDGSYQSSPPSGLGGNSRFVHEQFTGLKDKNGREIYEGDIVDDPNGIEVVWFSHGMFGSGVRHKPEAVGDYWGGMLIDENEQYIGEVIGNIHENGDLLK